MRDPLEGFITPLFLRSPLLVTIVVAILSASSLPYTAPEPKSTTCTVRNIISMSKDADMCLM